MMRSHSAPPDAAAAASVPLGGGLRLEWKLPLLVTGFVAAGLALMLVFTYSTLASRAHDGVRERLRESLAKLGEGADSSMAARARKLAAAAADPAVKRILAAPAGLAGAADPAAVRAALAPLRSRVDSTLPVEVWDVEGRVLVSTGVPLPGDARVLPPLEGGAAGAVRFGPQYAAGGVTRFWGVAPVVADGRRVGFVAQAGGVGGRPDAGAVLRALLSEEVTLYTRNADGRFWSAAPGTPVAAPTRAGSTARGAWYERAGVGRVEAEERPVAGTPWVMVMETPESWIVRRPRATTLFLASVGLALTLAAGVLSWLAGRRMARPLVALAGAAEAVARGRYVPFSPSAGRDEVGRLAAAFDAMARQVSAASRVLEHRVADAQGAADELAAANQQLREAMAEAERARADAERARGEAEQASRAKSDFLAVMSHELRTPLNAIGGYAQLMEMGLHGPVTGAQQEALARIARSQEHLLALINDVLSFARIDAGQMAYAIADVPLRAVLDDVEMLMGPRARAAELALHLGDRGAALVARADADKVRQVLVNLLANAVKYTPAGGSVTVECEGDTYQVRVRVRDTGTGIRPDRLPHIFEPFVQGDRALNRPDEGVGLGLTISRDLARGMGGDLRVESAPGQGSTFTLLLPRAGAPQVALPGVPNLDRGAVSSIG